MEVASAEAGNTSVCFTWTIENFTKKIKKLYSEIFLVGGYKWRVIIFPKGNNVVHLSIYLEPADSSTLPHGWSRYAQFSLGVVDQIHNKSTVWKDTQHQFNAKEADWGFTSFMPLSEIYDRKRGYLVNDRLVIEANVTVRNSKKKTGYVGLKNQVASAKAGNTVDAQAVKDPSFSSGMITTAEMENAGPGNCTPLSSEQKEEKNKLSSMAALLDKLKKTPGAEAPPTPPPVADPLSCTPPCDVKMAHLLSDSDALQQAYCSMTGNHLWQQDLYRRLAEVLEKNKSLEAKLNTHCDNQTKMIEEVQALKSEAEKLKAELDAEKKEKDSLKAKLDAAKEERDLLIARANNHEQELRDGGARAVKKYKKSSLFNDELNVLLGPALKHGFTMALDEVKGIYPVLDPLNPLLSPLYEKGMDRAYDERLAELRSGIDILTKYAMDEEEPELPVATETNPNSTDVLDM